MSEAVISGFQIYHGFLSGYMNISKHREHLNDINVFPVPDGDTGNNMIRTFRSIITSLKSSRSPGRILNHIADLSLEGARGNSGIIVSQYLNGLAKNAENLEEFTVENFGVLVKESVNDAYMAMESPREGTMLSVIKAWADAIYTESQGKISFTEILSRGFDSAKLALERTPDQLAVLKENNVVDAGAWGFVSFLEGIEKMQKEGPVPLSIRKGLSEANPLINIHPDHKSHTYSQVIDYRYCTEALIEKPTLSSGKIKDLLREKGNSLIVSSGRNKMRVHIHTNEPAELINLLRPYGTVIQQKVDDMTRQAQAVNSRLGRIAILTDSIADIPLEILDKYQIHVLNLKLIWDHEEFLDRLTMLPEEFYYQQSIRSSFPGSSVPDRTQVDGIYQFLMEHYDGIIVLPVAKALSGTWQQMNLAAAAYNSTENQIEVVDTCLNSAAQGLMVVEIAKAAAEGKGLEELRLIAEEIKLRSKIYVSVHTFKYMVKGGRVSPLKGFVAKVLNLKPIVSLDGEGRGIAFDKAFSQKGLMKKIEKLILDTEDKKGISEYAVVHALAPEEASKFASVVEKITGKPPAYITSISPIVGMHSGKGAVAIGIIEGRN